MNSTQLSLGLDWGREPWLGFRPRALTRVALRDVDKSDTLPEPARADEIYPDPAQMELWVFSHPSRRWSDGS